jgi:hypothetical protein
VPLLITANGFWIRFWAQVSRTPFDCSVISTDAQQTGMETSPYAVRFLAIFLLSKRG